MKKLGLGLLVFLFFLVTTQSVLAITIAPAKIYLDYEPGHTYTMVFDIANFDPVTTVFVPKVEGDFTEYVTIVNDDPSDFTVEFKMPSIIRPGLHEMHIGGAEEAKKGYSKGSLGAFAGVYSRVQFYVPYPAKYAEAHISQVDVKVGETAYFTVTLKNYGSDPIVVARGNVMIYDTNNISIAKVPLTSEQFIDSMESVSLYGEWDTLGHSAGIYKIVANIDYDGNITIGENVFRIGEKEVEILTVYANNTEVDRTVNINVEVQSKWNDIMKNVYAYIRIHKNGQLVEEMKSASLNLQSWQSAKLRGYWDTTGLEVGIYNVDVTVHYERETAKMSTQIYLMEKKEVKRPIEMTGIIAAIIALVIAVIFLGFAVMKRKKGS